MTKPSDDFMTKLLNDFYVEAAEHRQAIVAGLIELEQAPSPEKQHALIEVCFREVHSLKGAGRAVNLTEVERLCQALESVFAALERGTIVLSPALFDTLHGAVDALDRLLIPQANERASGKVSDLTALVRNLEAVSKGGPIASEPSRALSVPGSSDLTETTDKPESSPDVPVRSSELDILPPAHGSPALTETVRISTARLSALLLQAEELIAAKLIVSQHTAEIREIHTQLETSRKGWERLQATQDSLQTTNQAAQWSALREWHESTLKPLEGTVTNLTQRMEQDHRLVGRMVDTLLEDTKKTLMFPFSSLLEIFPKLVRDLTHGHGKEVSLTIQGGETEIDRRILEEIKDPLIHMVRNCLDHGIEKPDVRVQKNKPPRGTLTITVSQKDSRWVEVVVADDGAGIDPIQVRNVAVRLGVITPEAAANLTETEALDLIFGSGISTSPIITDLSGRGLGLAIVREKVGKLGGTISLETQPDVGTTFRLSLPLTLAGFRGVTVRVNDQTFVIPTVNVERVMRVRAEDIATVQNRETLNLNGQSVALINLAEVLKLPSQDERGKKKIAARTALVLGASHQHIAFLVDELLGEQEVLVKGLGSQLRRVRNFAGATVLGNGKVVPILNVSDLMDSALRLNGAATKGITAVPSEVEVARGQSILVAEDSITSRTLMKNILETAGYTVRTAVDGREGLAMLRSGAFDLLVSDVEMPHMNGFELTAQVRSDKRLAELPVILVTALQSQEDRERGMEAGANAYIVKSSFDQSDLLEVIRRLI